MWFKQQPGLVQRPRARDSERERNSVFIPITHDKQTHAVLQVEPKNVVSAKIAAGSQEGDFANRCGLLHCERAPRGSMQ
jgi:hypothetical protein